MSCVILRNVHIQSVWCVDFTVLYVFAGLPQEDLHEDILTGEHEQVILGTNVDINMEE